MKSKDEIDKYIDRIEGCIPRIIRSISLYIPREVAGLKLPASQVLTLASLFRKEIWKMSELAESVNMSMSAMTGIVDGLVRSEFVERKRDAKDRRCVLVYLTTKGRKIVNKIRAYRKREIRCIIEYLAENEKEIVISGFEKAVEAISARAETKKQGH
jgi:DNA-binding MarR family transcriptional regulator